MTRLAGAVLLEIHDEWAIAERRYLAEGSMASLTGSPMTNGPRRWTERRTCCWHPDRHHAADHHRIAQFTPLEGARPNSSLLPRRGVEIWR